MHRSPFNVLHSLSEVGLGEMLAQGSGLEPAVILGLLEKDTGYATHPP
jgi:hypothetical protein